MSVILSIRVFLRAINTYADTMNQKFLNNDDFEVQVSVYVCGCRFYLVYSAFTIFNMPLLLFLTFPPCIAVE